MKPTRIDRIRAALKKHGPMTVIQISEKTGISRSNCTGVISEFRADPGRKMRIRKAGKKREGNTTLSYVFELSNEPDVHYEPPVPPSVARKIKYPGMDREEVAHQKFLKALAAQIRPFRDPLVFLTAGRAP